MTHPEQILLSIMWPVAVGLLGLALLETAGVLFGRNAHSALRVIPGLADGVNVTAQGEGQAFVPYTRTGSASGPLAVLEDCGREFVGRTSAYPVPQAFAVVLALGTAILRSGMWRGRKSGEMEGADVPLIVVDEAEAQ